MDQILVQCPGTNSIADDVGVFGGTEEEHNANLHQQMRAAQNHGLVFNGDKCKIKTSKLYFFGLVFDANGVHPDPARIDDIRRKTKPADADELREFLGIATYMSPFIPKLSVNTATLRDLIKKDSIFAWNSSHDKAFESTKKLICREVTLAYFKSGADTEIQVDASGRGLGAVFIQAGKPIAFASKSLSDCETRYANIEREMLVVVFGCERFHTYVWGTRYTVESGHKPLEMIILKNLAAAPQRLQRMLLRIQPYDVQIRYRPGNEMALADTLSRQPWPDNTTIELDVQISHVQFSTRMLDDLRRETMNDSELQNLLNVIVDGWLIVSATYTHNYDHSGPIEMSLWKMTALSWRATGSSCQQVSSLRPWWSYTNTTRESRRCVYAPAHACFGTGSITTLTLLCASVQRAKKCSVPNRVSHSYHTRHPWQIVGTDLFVINRETYLLV